MKLLSWFLTPNQTDTFHRVQVPHRGVSGRELGVAIKTRGMASGTWKPEHPTSR